MFGSHELELLPEMFRCRSEEAFRALVERHFDLVYAVPLRETRQPDLAQDVTQAVFMFLMKKGRHPSPEDQSFRMALSSHTLRGGECSSC